MSTTNPSTASAQPGWYADPTQPSLLHYFDGTSWTEATMPAPGATDERLGTLLPDQPAARNTAASPGLVSRASRVSKVLGSLAGLALVVGVALTWAGAASYSALWTGELGRGAGTAAFVAAATAGAIMTALIWANLRLGAVVAEYIATRSA